MSFRMSIIDDLKIKLFGSFGTSELNDDLNILSHQKVFCAFIRFLNLYCTDFYKISRFNCKVFEEYRVNIFIYVLQHVLCSLLQNSSTIDIISLLRWPSVAFLKHVRSHGAQRISFSFTLGQPREFHRLYRWYTLAY